MNADVWDFSTSDNPDCNHILQAIPVAHPDQPINIHTNNGVGCYYASLHYDDDTDNLYFVGFTGGQGGFFRIHKENGEFNTEDIKNISIWSIPGYLYYQSLIDVDQMPYKWTEGYYNEDGSVNAALILEMFFNCCEEGDKVFKLDAFADISGFEDLAPEQDGLTNEDAILFLYDPEHPDAHPERLSKLADYLGGNSTGPEEFIRNTCFFTTGPNAGQSAVKEDSTLTDDERTEWAFISIQSVAYTSKGAYSFVQGWTSADNQEIKGLMQIVDENGCLCHNIVSGSSWYSSTACQEMNDKVIFKDDGDGDNTLILFDPQTGTFTDLFQNVPGTPVVIESYCCGEDCVYFSGMSGTAVISGKIDVETLEHTRIESAKKMTQIVAIKEEPDPVI